MDHNEPKNTDALFNIWFKQDNYCFNDKEGQRVRLLLYSFDFSKLSIFLGYLKMFYNTI